jgi:hypothetical protein
LPEGTGYGDAVQAPTHCIAPVAELPLDPVVPVLPVLLDPVLAPLPLDPPLMLLPMLPLDPALSVVPFAVPVPLLALFFDPEVDPPVSVDDPLLLPDVLESPPFAPHAELIAAAPATAKTSEYGRLAVTFFDFIGESL